MTQAIVIGILIAIALGDEVPAFPVYALDGGWVSIGVLGSGPMAIGLVSVLWVLWRTRKGGASLVALDQELAVSRLGILVAHLIVVLGFGLPGLIRDQIGDLILADEAIAAAPALGGLVLTWVAAHRIERSIDRGAPGVLASLVDHIRHEALLYLIPIGALFGWSEAVDRPLGDALAGGAPWVTEVVRWAGILVILLLSPLVLRVAWRTTRFPRGEVRDRLLDLAKKHKVRFHALLLWRPVMPIANAAVIGPIRFTRLILISEALLARLRAEELEAVMAHEVAHAKNHHLPWMMVGLLSVLSLSWYGVWAGLEWSVHALDIAEIDEWLSGVLMAGSLVPAGVVSFLAFGYVSRRFELQADAFAAAHMSGESEGITEAGADTMAHALIGVAHANHLPIGRWTFRHGSIEERVARLYSLAGEKRNRTWIDRRVRWIKVGIAVLGIGLGVWMALGG